MGRVELEWNPFSAASRAARADRAGRYAEALRFYAEDGHGEQLVETRLHTALPDWPVCQSLIQVACELVLLERGARLARRAGVPAGMTSPIAKEAEETAEIVWRAGNRIAAAARQQIDATRLQAGLAREAKRLKRLLDTIQSLRNELAELTLSGTPGSVDRDEERSVLGRLQALATVARELRDQSDA